MQGSGSRFFVALAIGAAVLARPIIAQDGDAARFERVARVTAAGAAQFYQRLRVALGQDNRAAACALLAYPLNHSSGTLASAGECQERFDAVFTIDVRKAVGKQAFEDLFVNERGVMVGLGEVWIGGRCASPPCGPADLRVIAVNSSSAGLVPPQGKVLLACTVAPQLLHVSADGSGGAELRLWPSGRSSDAPSLTLSNAIAGRDDRCGARRWTFADGPTRYTVSDLACDAHLAPPPMGAVGELVIERAGGETRGWCDQ